MKVQQSIPMLPVAEAVKLFAPGPIPAKSYYDAEWWELERRAIFMRTWIHIGHVCEIPESGSFIRREVEFAKASLLIMRGKDGEVRAFHNACTHRGTQLTSETCGKRATFSCPYHMWTFGTDGALLSAPDFEKFHVDKEDVGLKAVATEVVAGMIFINFDPAPRETVREFLGPIVEEMEMLPVARAVDFVEWTYDIPANWKTNFDNFQENYHLRFIHKSAAGQATGPENPFGYPTHYGFYGPHRSQRLWKNPAPHPGSAIQRMAHAGSAELAAEEGLDFPKTDFKLFPCFHIVGIPPAQQFTHTHYPLGPDRTRAVVRMYWTKQPDTAVRALFQEFAAMSIRDVLTEDRPAVVSAQRGLSSGAISHLHLQDHEVLLRHMHTEVVLRVEEYLAESCQEGASA